MEQADNPADNAVAVGILVDVSVPDPGPDTPSPCKTPKMNGRKVLAEINTNSGSSPIDSGTKVMDFFSKTKKSPRLVLHQAINADNVNNTTTDSVGKNGNSSQDELKLLDAEEFDFDIDLSLSPEKSLESSKGPVKDDDEDEIFFGEVGFKEKCKTITDLNDEPELTSGHQPLSDREMAMLFTEAQTMSHRIMLAAEDKKANGLMKSKENWLWRQVKESKTLQTKDENKSSSSSDKGQDVNCDKVLKIQPEVTNEGQGQTQVKGELESKGQGSTLQISQAAIDKTSTDSPLRRQKTFRVISSPLAKGKHPIVGMPTDGKGVLSMKERATSTQRKFCSPPKSQSTLKTHLSKPVQVVGRLKKLLSPTKKPKKAEKSLETSVVSDSSETSTTSSTYTSRVKRSIPKLKSLKSGIVPPGSKLHKRSDSNSSMSSIGSNTSQCSNISNTSQTSGLRAPAPLTKFNLMKAATIMQKSTGLGPSNTKMTKPTAIKKVSGPMKATLPQLQTAKVSTPKRPTIQKKVMPKRLINAQYIKESENSSTSSNAMSTPGSVQGKRISFLPTPIRKSRPSSIQSPLSVRSNYSGRSLSSDCNSSVFEDESVTNSGQSKGSAVQHTPLVGQKQRNHSGWTPIRKPARSIDEEIHRCTKAVQPK